MEKKISSARANVDVSPERVKTIVHAAQFIDSVGFCILFPLKNVPLPSLYYEVSHRSDARWDKYAQLIWKWKDELPRIRRAFYGKYFKSRGTFLSLESLSYLIAMHETAVRPSDHESLYAAGRISDDARAIWKAIAEHGRLPTLELRHASKMESQPGNKRFKKAMLELQALLLVTHSGAEQETDSWASNRFDLVSRAFPEQLEQARHIAPSEARRALTVRYRRLYPEAPPMQIARLFGWTKAQAAAALAL
jgi:Winged helix DNA-binding domain